ncbi:hypothetical protein DN412_27775 [Cupriavidus lacunae]|uniref:Uncharacterized protein n=1 Tax=Cupriavidus lacunae TaxID=2666307 RepID=A0A370NNK3_9BURK|nr:hypothetical protein DN412_27775 [Cupriavidus lacunae]
MGRLRLRFAPALTWQADDHVLFALLAQHHDSPVRAQRRTPCPGTRPTILSARSAAVGVLPMTSLAVVHRARPTPKDEAGLRPVRCGIRSQVVSATRSVCPWCREPV